MISASHRYGVPGPSWHHPGIVLVFPGSVHIIPVPAWNHTCIIQVLSRQYVCTLAPFWLPPIRCSSIVPTPSWSRHNIVPAPFQHHPDIVLASSRQYLDTAPSPSRDWIELRLHVMILVRRTGSTTGSSFGFEDSHNGSCFHPWMYPMIFSRVLGCTE